MDPLSRSTVTVLAVLIGGLFFMQACDVPPRHPAKSPTSAASGGAVAAASGAPTTTAPATTATATATTTAPTPTPTPTSTPTATAGPPIGTWPAPTSPGMPGWDPNVLADIARGMGLPIPALPGATTGDPLEAALKTSAAKYAPGFTPASPVGKATLKLGEHAGMNVDMEHGKCYVVLGAGGLGVTKLGLNLLFPAAPPQAIMASDTAHGAHPVLGEGKPLCPPTRASVRVDAAILAGAGDVAVQVWGK